MLGQSGCAPAYKKEVYQWTASALMNLKKQRKQTSLSWSIVSTGPYLCGLTLLLKLLQLLGSKETHWLIASDELGSCWHGREDDVAAQSAETVRGKQMYV